MQVSGVAQETRTELVEGLLHRIERISHAGQDRRFHQDVEGLGQVSIRQRIQRQAVGQVGACLEFCVRGIT